MNLYNRNLLTLLDYSPEEVMYLLNLSSELKKMKKEGKETHVLKNKNIALLFEKDSTRTRCSFEVAAYDLGMHVTYLGPTGSQMGKKESIKDTARVLGRMFDGIEFRGFKHETVEELAAYANVPVWNGLTDRYHPTQVLADALTILEHKGKLKGIKMAYLGDARYNMGNSLMIMSAKLGLDFRAVGPKSLMPSKELVEKCLEVCKETSGKITLTESIEEGVKDVDVVVTDVWVSMGEPDSVWKERIEMLLPYQVNKNVMALAKDDAIFLHCLPSFHNLETKIGMEIYEKYGLNGLEVTEDVFESEQSVVFDEAENRLHTIKAVIYATMVKDE
ncbi:ornithine carbamoyltransferase [Coprobacillus sp. CAG:698]|nr:ornithine carbamoyltransferase [Coprobacillus sp. CAG:698]